MCDNPKFMTILKSDCEGRLNAWDVRQEYELLAKHKVCVFPAVSRAQNWGFDSRSDHCTGLQGVAIPILADEGTPHVAFEPLDAIGVQEEIRRAFLQAYKQKSLLMRFVANVRWFGLGRTLGFYYRRMLSKLMGK